MSGTISGGNKPKKGLMGNKIVENFTEEQFIQINEKILISEQKFNSSKDQF